MLFDQSTGCYLTKALGAIWQKHMGAIWQKHCVLFGKSSGCFTAKALGAICQKHGFYMECNRCQMASKAHGCSVCHGSCACHKHSELYCQEHWAQALGAPIVKNLAWVLCGEKSTGCYMVVALVSIKQVSWLVKAPCANMKPHWQHKVKSTKCFAWKHCVLA